MSRERSKQTFKLHLLAFVLMLAIIWYGQHWKALKR
jgi:hypothetical protein